VIPKLLKSQDDMRALVRARLDELCITHEVADELTGMASGYTSKLMCGMKNFGWQSMPAYLDALGIGLVAVVDTLQTEKMRHRWTRRKRPQKLAGTGGDL
jgi:hypothetical protein